MPTTAAEFVRREIASGRLTHDEISLFVRYFQDAQGIEPVDGKPGPVTQDALASFYDVPVTEKHLPSPFGFGLVAPMPVLPDGRRPVITSGFRPRERPDHVGVDIFYPWRPGDKPDFVADKGAAGSPGKPRWGVPYGIHAIAAGDGVVSAAGDSRSGKMLWIDHGNDFRTGYFHLMSLLVVVGQRVTTGQNLGLVGDNPVDGDARHLHFELSPVRRYAPENPVPYLRGMGRWEDH